MTTAETLAPAKAKRDDLAGRRLRLGMVGGGEGAYIGGIHRYAARLDNQYDLIGGAFDVNAERGHAFAAANYIAPDRSYDSYQAMAAAEAGRPDGVDVVAIRTPNFTHYPIAKAFLDAGIDVICEKPLTATLAEADGIELEGNAQAAWRTDPKKNGRGGSIGDIGTHAYHLAGYVTGLKAEAIAADLATFVPGRALDDNAHVMIRYQGGARGLLWSSQVAIGQSNGLRLRVFGAKGSLVWAQEQPNELVFTPLFGAPVTIKRGREDLTDATRARVRTPPGHPEGCYIEACANLYSGFAEAIRARAAGRKPGAAADGVPTAYDGLRGVAFVEAVVDCHQTDALAWTAPKYV